MIKISVQSIPGQFRNVFLALLVFIGLCACGSDNPVETEIDQDTATQEAPHEPHSQEQHDEYETGAEYTYDANERVGRLPRVTSITIATMSPDIRDGFKALVETDNADNGELDIIYQWKLNGEDIIGATDQEIEWQDEFAKGDTLTVAAIPVSEIGQGALQVEGSIVIPNSPPEIISEPGALFDAGEFNYTVEAVDPDGDSFDFTLRGAPKGMIIEPATGLITWEYGAEDTGDFEVIIVVSDSDGAETMQTLNFTIHEEGSTPDSP